MKFFRLSEKSLENLKDVITELSSSLSPEELVDSSGVLLMPGGCSGDCRGSCSSACGGCGGNCGTTFSNCFMH